MPRRRSAFLYLLLVAPAIASGATAQTPQYRSPAGIEYRAQSDTGPIARARAASAADSANIELLIQLGVAQSGFRQFREAIQTFLPGVAMPRQKPLAIRRPGHPNPPVA